MRKVLAAGVWLLGIATNVAWAEVKLSGFASINAGKVLSGEGAPQVGVDRPTFLADYPMVSVYTDEWELSPESLFGVQATANLGDGLLATAQLMSRGSHDYDVTMEWAYVSYQLNEEWTLQAGKKHLPLFYYSDFYDIGYAYVWMRAPADNYTWQITSYNGVSTQFNGLVGNWMINADLYAGEEEDEENRLLSDFFLHEKTKEAWRNIKGLVITSTHEWFELRATAMSYTNEREVDDDGVMWDDSTSRDGLFYGVAANLEFPYFFVLTELSRLSLEKEKFDTRMVTAGVRQGQWIPFVGYSDFHTKGAQDGEAHSTLFAGFRWDFHASAALKAQYDQVDDKSFSSAVAGDSKALTLGMDIVF